MIHHAENIHTVIPLGRIEVAEQIVFKIRIFWTKLEMLFIAVTMCQTGL